MTLNALAAIVLIGILGVVIFPLLAQCNGKSLRARDAVAKARPLVERFYAITGRWPKDYAELARAVPHNSHFSYENICMHEFLGCRFTTRPSSRDDLSRYTLTFDREENGVAFFYLRPPSVNAAFKGYHLIVDKPPAASPTSTREATKAP